MGIAPPHHAAIGDRAGDEVGNGDALVIAVPLLAATGTTWPLPRPCRGKAGIERAATLKGRRRIEAHGRQPLLAARMNIPSGAISAGYMNGPSGVSTDHGETDVGGGGDGGKRRLRVIARQQAPIEGLAQLRPATLLRRFGP